MNRPAYIHLRPVAGLTSRNDTIVNQPLSESRLFPLQVRQIFNEGIVIVGIEPGVRNDVVLGHLGGCILLRVLAGLAWWWMDRGDVVVSLISRL